MPRFVYQTVDQENIVRHGAVDAPDCESAAAQISQGGRIPLSIREVGPINSISATAERSTGPTLPRRTLTSVLQQLRLLLSSGLELDAALGVLLRTDSSSNTKAILERVRQEIRSGTPLSVALVQADARCPNAIASVLRAGETGGNLDEALAHLTSHLERAEKLSADVKSALIYPTLLLLMSVAAVMVVLTFLIPEMRTLFDDSFDRLPLVTRLVFSFSDALTAFAVPIAATVIFAVLALRSALRNARYRVAWDGFMLRLPFGWGRILTEIEIARWARLLGMLLRSGVQLDEAIGLVAASATNRAFAATTSDAQSKLKEGQRLAEALSCSPLYPPLFVDLLRVGEEASNLVGVLKHIADLYDEQVERSLKRLTDMLVPLLTIVLGLLVGGLIVSVLIALLSMNDLAFAR